MYVPMARRHRLDYNRLQGDCTARTQSSNTAKVRPWVRLHYLMMAVCRWDSCKETTVNPEGLTNYPSLTFMR